METLEQEHLRLTRESEWLAQFYKLKDGKQINPITTDLLTDPDIKPLLKEKILANHRQIFAFWYPSDEFKIKGFVSFTKNPEGRPLLILLRGGNRTWAILNPAGDLANLEDYTIISTTYRGGISEGEEEYGGADVRDVKHLIDFIPTLEKLLEVTFNPSRTFMLGASRGAMQMFLFLSRYPELQDKIDKIISLSGLLNIELQIQNRQDMKRMFEKDFGLQWGINDQTWIAQRNPILTVPFIKHSLPILIIQGAKDNRVSLQEGYQMVQALQKQGNHVSYTEIADGLHCLHGYSNRETIITDWLKNSL